MRWHEALSGWFQLVNGRFRPVPEGRWRRLTAIVCTVIGDASLRTARPTQAHPWGPAAKLRGGPPLATTVPADASIPVLGE